MKNKALFILFFLVTTLLPTIVTVAQGSKDFQQIIPPSPTASSLGIYGEIGVGYYTGLPDINIPLYQVQGRDINLPIHLQYNASGTKVADNASWVGLGWSLSAGGVITRTVKGLDDFKNNGDAGTGYYYTSAIPAANSPDGYDPVKSPTLDPARSYFERIATGAADGEPDNFSYNFGSFTGKFTLSKRQDGSVVFTDERNNLYIEYTNAAWRITDAKGYQYWFSSIETATNYTYSSTSQEAPSDIALNDMSFQPSDATVTTAWYLTNITAPSGEQIKFEYRRGESLSLLAKAEQEYDVLKPGISCPGGTNAPAFIHTYTASKQVISELYLTRVLFSQGSIEFVTTDREDIEYKNSAFKPAKLSEILIKDNNNTLLKRYVFKYSYFLERNTSNIRSLKLDALTEYGQVGMAKPPYVFTYYEPNNLFNRYSKAIDHWGYYNGRNNNTILPTFSAPEYDKIFKGANRQADAINLYPKYGVLTAIKYPTGGRTEFDYELHTYYNPKGEDRYEDISGSATAQVYPGNSLNNNTEFYIDAGLGDKVSVDVDYSFREANCAADGCQLRSTYTGLFHVEKKGNDGTWRDYRLIVNNPFPDADHPYWDQFNGSTTLLLEGGTYRVRVWYVPGYSLRMSASWNTRRFVKVRKGGGLRIKSITTFDGLKQATKRSFYYTLDGTTEGASCGLLITEPRYDVLFEYGQCSSPFVCALRTSGISFPIGLNTKGGIVGYEKVTEIMESTKNNGKIEYYYHNTADLIPSFVGLPTVGAPWNGKINQSIVYNSSGMPVKKTEYIYQTKEDFTLAGVKTFFPPYTSPTGLTGSFCLKYYYIHSRWNVLASQKETTYSDGREYSIIKKLFYDNTLHKEITREQVLTSTERSQVTRHLYAADYANTTGFIGAMKTAHILSTPIEQVVSTTNADGTDERIVSATVTTYLTGSHVGRVDQQWNLETATPISLTNFKYSNQATPGILPTTNPAGTFSLTGIDGRYSSRAALTIGYTAEGKVRQMQKDRAQPTSYLWSYNNNLPIAEANNATADEIWHENFEQLGGWDTALSYDAVISHTGHRAGKLILGQDAILHSFATNSLTVTLAAPKQFVFSGWVYTTGPTAQLWVFRNQPATDPNPAYATTNQTGKWVYLQQRVTVPAGTTQLTVRLTGSSNAAGQIWFDNLRLHPADTQMTTLTHDPLIGVTSVSDVNSRPIYYEYDALGRLLRVKDDQGRLRTRQEYHYAGQ